MGYLDDLDVLGAISSPAAFALQSVVPTHRTMAAPQVTDHRVAAHRANVVQAAAQSMVPQLPGVPGLGVRGWPLGFPTISFIVGGATSLQTATNPQRPFKGSRLVVSIARNNAGGSATGLITITKFEIGSNNQLVNANPIIADAFLGNSFQTILDLDPAQPGITITLEFAISAAPTVAGDSVDVGAMIIGASFAG